MQRPYFYYFCVLHDLFYSFFAKINDSTKQQDTIFRYTYDASGNRISKEAGASSG